MANTRVRILAPLSDRKRSGGERIPFREAQQDRNRNRYGSLTDDRAAAILAFLASINGMGFAELVLRLKGPRLDEVCLRNKEFNRGPLLPVYERDIGPLFAALDVATLEPDARRRLDSRLLILCPLLGLLSPADAIPEYRCPVGAQVPALAEGSVHAYWKPRITSVLDRLCRAHTVFSFLPTRLEALWDRRPESSCLVKVEFTRKTDDGELHEHAGARRGVGELIRHLVNEDIRDPEALTSWRSGAGHRCVGLEGVGSNEVTIEFRR